MRKTEFLKIVQIVSCVEYSYIFVQVLNDAGYEFMISAQKVLF